MKTAFTVVSLAVLLATPSAVAASARITSPAAGSTVNERFTVIGNTAGRCELFGVAVRNDDGSGGSVNPGNYRYGDSSFSIEIDTNLLQPTEGQSEITALKPGRVSLIILGRDECIGEITVPLTFAPNASPPAVSPSANPVPSPTVSISPASASRDSSNLPVIGTVAFGVLSILVLGLLLRRRLA